MKIETFLLVILCFFLQISAPCPGDPSETISSGSFQVFSLSLADVKFESKFPFETIFDCMPRGVILSQIAIKPHGAENYSFFLVEGYSWVALLGPDNFMNNLTQAGIFKNLRNARFDEEYIVSNKIRIEKFYTIGIAENFNERRIQTIPDEQLKIASGPINEIFSGYFSELAKKNCPIWETRNYLLRKHLVKAMKDSGAVPREYNNFQLPDFVLDRQGGQYEYKDVPTGGLLKGLFGEIAVPCIAFFDSKSRVSFSAKKGFAGIQIDDLLSKNNFGVFFLDGKAFVFPRD